MAYDGAAIAQLQAKDRLEMRVQGLEGRIRDLSRDNLIVHVGKPVGSITGWCGGIFWQVWRDHADSEGIVRARCDEREVEIWQLDAAEDPVLLDQAKDRMIAQATAYRLALLAVAHSDLAALQIA